MDSRFKAYTRTGLSYLRPYEPGEDLSGVSVSPEDDPASDLGFIAINPDNEDDQWYIARAYAEKHLALAPELSSAPGFPSHTADSRALRKELDATLQRLKGSSRSSRERSISATKIQEAIMWLGMDLKAQREEGLHDEPNPYPNSYDASSDAPVAPTADGLKL